MVHDMIVEMYGGNFLNDVSIVPITLDKYSISAKNDGSSYCKWLFHFYSHDFCTIYYIHLC